MRASVAWPAVVAWIAAGTASAQWGFVEEAKLIPSGAKGGERAGHAVALSGDTVVLGVPLRDHGSAVYATVRGLAYHTGKQALHGSEETTGTLLTISVPSGVATSVGETYYQPAGLAFDPAQNSFYVGDESGLLWRVKTNGTLTGAWDTGVTLAGLAFDSSTDTLYGSTSDQLVIIVPGPPGGIWAAASIVGPLGFSDVRGLEFDPASGTLYGTDCATDQLLSIDPATGTATALGPLGFGMVEGLALDTATNKLYGSDTESDQIVVIDPLAGAALPLAKVTGTVTWAGAAHVFRRNGTAWAEEAVLTASAPGFNDFFGWSVSVSGNTAVVGAPSDFAPPYFTTTNTTGAAFVFVRAGSQWVEQARLLASDGDLGDMFGRSVSVDGDTVLVGAPYGDNWVGTDVGSVYVFERQGTTWIETTKLAASTQSSGDRFGESVDLDGSRCLIGAPFTDVGTLLGVGVGYTFVRSGLGWSQESRLASDPAEASYAGGDVMGRSVALSGDTALLGAWGFDQWPSTNSDIGAAWVYTRSPAGWTERDRINGLKWSSQLDGFGFSVAAEGDRVVAGALKDPMGGRANLFTPQFDVWKKQLSVEASDVAPGDNFGWSVALFGDTLIVGAPFDDHAAGVDAGSAYVFRLAPPPPSIYCTAGTSASGCAALLSASGTPSASSASGFTVSASPVEGSRTGMFVFGQGGKQANPWGSSTSFQCAPPPLTASGPLPVIGALGACDGAFTLDLNALWCPTCPKPAINPGEGSLVQVQLWYRDPLNPSGQTTSFSNAIELWVLP